MTSRSRQEAKDETTKGRLLGLLVCAMLAALCSSAAAQQARKMYRIGYLSGLDRARESARSATIRKALHELGYVEGENIITEYRYIQGRLDRAADLATELVRLDVDVIIVAGGSGPILAVKKATKTIPIVMAVLSAAPVELGLVESISRPGGNVTGITTLYRELGGSGCSYSKKL